MNHSGLSSADRKEILVAQGAAYRDGIRHSRNNVRDKLHVEALAKGAINHIIMGAYTAFKTGAALKGGNMKMALPLVLAGISALSKKSLLKPIAGGAAVLGIVGVIVRLVMKRNARRAEQRGDVVAKYREIQ